MTNEPIAWAYYWPDGGMMDVLLTSLPPYPTLKQVPLYATKEPVTGCENTLKQLLQEAKNEGLREAALICRTNVDIRADLYTKHHIADLIEDRINN